MANQLLLTEEDLHQLTGYIRPDAQIRWLKKNGWEFAVSAYKRPKVAFAYAESKLGVRLDVPMQFENSVPDFSCWGGPSR